MERANVENINPYARRLVWLFAFVYFAQGIGQHGGLIGQPVLYFFKTALGFTPSQATEFLAVLAIPWTIKPLYGLISDFLPLCGYKRKSWLLLVNTLAAAGFAWLTGLTAAHQIVAALLITAFGTAASDVIIDAVMVENGKEFGMTAKFQSAQWLWISMASVCTSLGGGYLCTIFEPGTALHIAAWIVLLSPLSVMVASWLILREDKVGTNFQDLKAQGRNTARSLREAFRSKTLWAVLIFIACLNFSPSLGLPWYYHQLDTLKFTPDFIGVLGAIASVGKVVGAMLYGRFFASRPLRFQLAFSIMVGTGGTLAALALVTPNAYSREIAVLMMIVLAAFTMIANLSVLTLAAQACPAKAEGFTFAALMSVNNGCDQVAAIIGARLYTDVFPPYFDQPLVPLIWVSALTTLACLLLLPLLRRVPESAIRAPL